MASVLINSTEGKLEGIYKPNENPKAPMVLLMHPHPLYDGNMNNKVLVTMEKVFLLHNFTTLRFNFRGCGKSDGKYDNGKGELIDASTCLDWLTKNNPEASAIYVAGFSFGAYIALQLMVRRTEVERFISVSTPTNLFDISFVHPCPTDGIFIHADKDEVSPLKDANKVIQKFIKVKNRNIQFEIIKNADHFFTDKLDILSNILDKYIAEEITKGKNNLTNTSIEENNE